MLYVRRKRSPSPQPVWTLLRRKVFFTLPGNEQRCSCLPAPSRVTVPTELYLLAIYEATATNGTVRQLKTFSLCQMSACGNNDEGVDFGVSVWVTLKFHQTDTATLRSGVVVDSHSVDIRFETR